jgi:hypothetical protein
MFSDDPSSLAFWELPLKCLLQTIQHSDAFLISSAKRGVDFRGNVSFLSCHKQMVYRLRSLAAAPIHSLNLITDMTVIVFSASCAGELLEERRICEPISYLSSDGQVWLRSQISIWSWQSFR